jgi:peptide chain release factor 3
MSALHDQVSRRRTFAIISHPDAGKTTLTEKLLLFGGAIQLAGAVKARGDAGCTFNLLDTPGHEDFSEDTYRTLTAVDSAVMVIDAAKGIETQTRKLFEVCRLRDVPIVTFINKLDREGRDPLELMDEIESTLALAVTPASWPIGMGQSFLGCYDLLHERLVLLDRGAARRPGRAGHPRSAAGAAAAGGEVCRGLDDPRLDQRLPGAAVARLREEVHMARGLCPPFDLESYRDGHLTPVYFGSALNNFGVRELLSGLIELAPPPRPQPAEGRDVLPEEEAVSGFVFKIQANLDPKHRDRIAFVRLCSGRFRRGMKLLHVRSGKTLAMHNPVLFLAQDRELAEEAWAGDIIGIPNHGNLRIGDALTEGEPLRFCGVPSFAPELLRKVRPEDPMRGKHLGRALLHLAEEGAAQVFRPSFGTEWIVGVAGALQFDVLADRIRTEYGIPVHFEGTTLHTARWVEADDHQALKRFAHANHASMAEDHDGLPVFLARNAWHLKTTGEDWPAMRFLKTREQVQ